MTAPATGTYGLLARFSSPLELVAATRHVHGLGYRRIEAYSPFPVEGLADALEFRRTGMPLVVLTGGIAGCLGGFFLQYWVAVIAYPLNVGGRPLNSWPAFIPATFETTILVAALSGVLGMLALNGLPRPHHPLFGVPQFDRASRDGFFLCIEAADPLFDPLTTRALLETLAATEVLDVDN